MRRIADLTPGSAKTDAKDAAVIAGAARTMPHTLRAISTSDEDAAALSMLTGFDLDLARQVNQTANRIRGLYTQIHPALETILGPRPGHDAVPEGPSPPGAAPTALRKAGRARIDAKLKKHGARRHAAWAGKIVSALGRQTVTVTGTEAAGTVLPHLARQLIALHSQRADVAARVETLVRAHPHARGPDHPCRVSGSGPQPSSWPRPWARPSTPAPSRPPTSGPAPVTRRSGSSIRGERVCRTGNKRLKHAMFLSAFASLTDPVSRTYYQRKRDQGKRHNQALLALAHRRILTLHAMIRDGALYDPQPATKPPAAA